MILKVIILFLCTCLASSFAPISRTVTENTGIIVSSTSFFASQKPTYDTSTDRWTAVEGEVETLYGPVGSLLRHGPGPFIVRLTKPDDYMQAILKYQANDGCSMAEAQGNMDAYFNNAADWAYQKNAEKNGAAKADYTELRTKDAVLAVTWAVAIIPILARYVYVYSTTGSFDTLLQF